MAFGFAEPTGRMAERRSASEAEIRAAVVTYLRDHMPEARIIHELNVDNGNNRIDVAAVTETHIVAVEIKSKKDKLTRLAGQLAAFDRACHAAVAVLDERWWTAREAPHVGTIYDLDPAAGADVYRSNIWRYPRPAAGGFNGRWEFPTLGMKQPAARAMLAMLWRDELSGVASLYRIAHTARTSSIPLIDLIAYHCTGAEIARGVCWQLRSRPFAEADDPISPTPTPRGERDG